MPDYLARAESKVLNCKENKHVILTVTVLTCPYHNMCTIDPQCEPQRYSTDLSLNVGVFVMQSPAKHWPAFACQVAHLCHLEGLVSIGVGQMLRHLHKQQPQILNSVRH